MKNTILTINLDDELREWVDHCSIEKKVSRSFVIRKAIESLMKTWEKSISSRECSQSADHNGLF